MTRRVVCLVITVIMLLTIPVYAASPKLADILPDITFDDTTAICTLEITADNAKDKIVSTMELWQGSKKIDDWTASGVWYVSMEEFATVERNKTYRLVVHYSINGVSKPSITIYRTNR